MCGRNRDAAVENRHVVLGGGGEAGANLETSIDVYTLCVCVQSVSRVQLFETPWTAAYQASLFFAISQSLLKLMSIESMMPSNHLLLSCPLLHLPSIFASIRVFSDEPVFRIRWTVYWSFSFSITPSNEYSGLISFRIDWLDLLAVQGTPKSPSTSQFKNISSSLLNSLYSPTLTFIHDYCKNHSFG